MRTIHNPTEAAPQQIQALFSVLRSSNGGASDVTNICLIPGAGFFRVTWSQLLFSPDMAGGKVTFFNHFGVLDMFKEYLANLAMRQIEKLIDKLASKYDAERIEKKIRSLLERLESKAKKLK